MEIRPLTDAEQKYTYRQSMQIRGQTGSIGILQGGYGADHEFHSDFQELSSHLNTDEFAAELQEVLCSGENSILQNLDIMQEFAMQHNRNGFPGKEYGFRVETENHAYLVRCNPEKEGGSIEVHCYVKKWLDHHIGEAERGIRFIDSRYNELFRTCLPGLEDWTLRRRRRGSGPSPSVNRESFKMMYWKNTGGMSQDFWTSKNLRGRCYMKGQNEKCHAHYRGIPLPAFFLRRKKEGI